MLNIVLATLMGIITICAYIGYIPQIVRLLKTKYSKDLSIFSWGIWIFSTACGTAYGILLRRVELVVMYASELVLSLIILFLIIKYRKNDVKN